MHHGFAVDADATVPEEIGDLLAERHLLRGGQHQHPPQPQLLQFARKVLPCAAAEDDAASAGFMHE
ncbi:hypothetical protein D3C87_2211170 [compost metagenome]